MTRAAMLIFLLARLYELKLFSDFLLRPRFIAGVLDKKIQNLNYNQFLARRLQTNIWTKQNVNRSKSYEVDLNGGNFNPNDRFVTLLNLVVKLMVLELSDPPSWMTICPPLTRRSLSCPLSKVITGRVDSLKTVTLPSFES